MPDSQYSPDPAIVAMMRVMAEGLEAQYRRNVETNAEMVAMEQRLAAELGRELERDEVGPLLVQMRASLDEMQKTIAGLEASE